MLVTKKDLMLLFLIGLALGRQLVLIIVTCPFFR